MRRFLLVAPLVVDAATLPLADDRQPTTARPSGSSRMHSQEQFDAGALTQTYVRHADEPGRYPDTFTLERDGAAVRLDDIRLVLAAGVVLLHAGAVLDDPPDGAAAGLSVPQAERLLSDAVRGYVGTHIQPGLDVSWVNRTLIAPESAVPADWLASTDDSERIVLRTGGRSPVLTVGWGNNVLEFDDGLDRTVRGRLLEGLCDAQVLWQQLDRISQQSAELIRAYREPADDKRGMTAEQVDAIAKDLATHNLYYDELLLNLQGTRKQVAAATLRAWGYTTLLDRVSRRVNEIERVARQEAETRQRRYQGIVEAVLLAIGLVSLLQLLLAMVQTAFSGGEDRVPGGQDRLSIMEFLRRMDLDLAIWLTALATVLAFLGIVLIKRRA